VSRYANDPSASRRLVAFVLFIIGVTLTISLFYVKTRAQTAKEHVIMLERSISEQEAAMTVLRAELAVLESPERIAVLAKDVLSHAPISVEQTLTPEELIKLIPLRDNDAREGEAK